jgi:hypothetical protein
VLLTDLDELLEEREIIKSYRSKHATGPERSGKRHKGVTDAGCHRQRTSGHTCVRIRGPSTALFRLPARVCRGGKCKPRGVRWCKRSKEWEAQIWDKGNNTYLGTFDTEREEAPRGRGSSTRPSSVWVAL